MEILSFGVASLKIGDIDPETGLLEAGTLVSVGDIYKDTCDLMESDPAKTPIYAEQAVNPRHVFATQGEESLVFSLMSTAADSLVTVLGGTVTTVGGVKSWNKPKGYVNIEKFVELITLDGTKVVYPRGSISGKRDFKFRRNGINLVPVSIVPLDPKVANVPAVIVTDPAA